MPEPVLLHVQYRFCGANQNSTLHYRFWGIFLGSRKSVTSQYRFSTQPKSVTKNETVSVMSQYRFSTQPKSVMAEPVMGTQLRTGGGND